jgi:hypothetical protein
MTDAAITYADRRTPVRLGDRVQIRGLAHSYTGRIAYLPGTSGQHLPPGADGLAWVGIEVDGGGLLSFVVDPGTHEVKGRIALLDRQDAIDDDSGPDALSRPSSRPHQPRR